MLKDFCEFINQLEYIYIKELDANLVLNFIENFYKNFLNKNSNTVEFGLLTKTISTIIVGVDSLILQKSPIKDHWIHRTGENYLLNMNRGNEIIDNTIKDLLGSVIIHQEVSTIMMILLISGVDSSYKKEFILFFNESKLPQMNIENNLKIGMLNKLKPHKYPLLYIFIAITIMGLLLTEIYYFIILKSIINSSGLLLLSLRSYYVV